MGYFDETSGASTTDVETPGKYLTKFVGARVNIVQGIKPKAQVLLDFRVEDGQTHAGATKTDWLTITGASAKNKEWMFQRFMHAFGLTEDVIRQAVADAPHDGAVAAALVRLVEPFKNRKVWMTVIKNNAGYINIAGGKRGTVPYVEGETGDDSLDGLGEFAPNVNTNANADVDLSDPWEAATTATFDAQQATQGQPEASEGTAPEAAPLDPEVAALLNAQESI